MQARWDASEVGCVTIATSWVIGRTVPFWWSTQGVGSRCSHWAVRAVLLFLLLGWRKHPPGWDKEVQHPWIWVDGDEEEEGWKWWSWRLYFAVIYAALFVVLFFCYHICLKHKQSFSMLHIFCLFSRPCSFLVVSVIFGITIWPSSLNLFSTMMCAQYCGGFELQRSIYQPLRLPFCFVEATCVFLSHRYSNTLLLLWQSGSQRERISLIRHGFVWVLRLEAPCCCNQGSDAVPAVQYFWLWFILVKRKQKNK